MINHHCSEENNFNTSVFLRPIIDITIMFFHFLTLPVTELSDKENTECYISFCLCLPVIMESGEISANLLTFLLENANE